jgi:acetyltransferase-like isoleucine patch superfamily enzyme
MKNILIKIRKKLCLAIVLFIKYLPFNLMIKIRTFCYGYLMKSMGICNICDGVTIINPSSMQIGDRVSIHPYTYIVGEVVIGDNVGIAAKCSIIAQSHNYSDPLIPFKEQGIVNQPIFIGNDVWIGTNSVILGGVKIGDGVIIGAGSVVKREIPPYSVVMGNPARIAYNRKKTDFHKKQ